MRSPRAMVFRRRLDSWKNRHILEKKAARSVSGPTILLGLSLVGLILPASSAGLAAEAEMTVEVTPGPEYRADGLHRLLFGKHYRDLWTTPLHVPVLDLRSFAGGLTPTKRGGGLQTK